MRQVLSRAPWEAVAGDFVRAEAWTPALGRHLLRKEDVLPSGLLCRIMTNRKVAWQRKA